MKLSSLIGLSHEKRKARLLIRACLNSGEIFPHTLLYGVGGTGKTALARAIGNELNYHFVETHAAVFKNRSVLFDELVNHLEAAKRSHRFLLFFLDEIHRLSLNLQEGLYQAMKEFWLPTSGGQLAISPFTLFGATTRCDMLDSNSFVSRFENVWEIQRYSVEDIAIIVANELSKHKMRFSVEVAIDIAKRCLGIPRIAVNLANKVRRVAQSDGSQEITFRHCSLTFQLERIDDFGLQDVHHRYMEILFNSSIHGKMSPLGVGAISAKMRQPEDVIKGSIEPILLEKNFIAPTPRGRVLTQVGLDYFNTVSQKEVS